jgi:hypothetical protein
MINFFKHVLKYILKKRIFKMFAIVTMDIIKNESFVTIGSLKASSRYKCVYLGKENITTNSLKISFNILKKLKTFHNKYGIVNVQDSNLAELNRNLFVMQPDFIVLEIPLPETYDEYLKSITNDARNNLKKVQKIGFTCSVCKDKKWVNTFYDDYYVLTMVDRHSEDAAIISKKEMNFIVDHPGAEFVKLFLDGKCVAAALTIFTENKYFCQKIGYLNGDFSLLQKGIVTAIYQFRIQRAFELGCKKIILGGTPPFLENGVFKYKAKWQARFCINEYFTENYLLLNPRNNYCYNFLQSNSLVVFGLKNTLIVLSSKKPDEISISSNTLSDIKSWYLLSGVYIDNYSPEMEDLPEHLRHWYEKIY